LPIAMIIELGAGFQAVKPHSNHFENGGAESTMTLITVQSRCMHCSDVKSHCRDGTRGRAIDTGPAVRSSQILEGHKRGVGYWFSSLE
jgi:hypothetical protein